MTPIYDRDGVTLYHDDSRAVMARLSGAGVVADLVLADPPYGDTSLEWDRWPDGWPMYAHGVLGPNGSMWVFGSMRMFRETVGDFEHWQQAQDIVWEKHNGSSFHADRFKRVHEHAVQFYPVGRKWSDVYKLPQTTPDATPRTVRRKQRPPHTGHIEASSYESHDGGPRLMRSVLQVRSCHGYAEHPTQKPEGILEPLLRYSVPPGGLVIDPFCGSGTTLVVARRLGLRAIGIETRRQYCDVTIRRLAQGVLPFASTGAA